MIKVKLVLNGLIGVMKLLVNLTRRIPSTLGAVSSTVWGALYILLIPGFALLYTFLPSGSFYHSTVTNEVLYREDKATLRVELETWADSALTSRLSEAIESIESRKPRQIDYYAEYFSKEKSPNLKVIANFNGSPKRYFDFSLENMAYVTAKTEANNKIIDGTTEISEGFNLKGKCTLQEGNNCKARLIEQALKPNYYFKAPNEIRDLVSRLRIEASGLNYGLGYHTFGRMLYFSAMTVTTVGYGDIVPLTDISRMLVSSEAISGVILIGLFLNAVAQGIQQKAAKTETNRENINGCTVDKSE